MNRRAFAAGIANLDFTMLVPDGFAQPSLPDDIASSVNLDSPTESCPLALIASPVAAAFIAVAARPAYGDGSVEQWLRFLAGHFGINLGQLQAVKIGMTHDGVAVQGHQVQDGMNMILSIVAFEDGARLVTAHAICPDMLWPSFGRQLVESVLSLRLDHPLGGIAPVLAPVTDAAAPQS